MAQLYTNAGGFSRAFIYKNRNSPASDDVPLNDPAGTDTSDTAQFTLTASEDELIVNLAIVTTQLNQTIPFEIIARTGSHSGLIALNFSGDITTDGTGVAMLNLSTDYTPVLVDREFQIFVTVNCDNMLGVQSGPIFVPNGIVTRIVIDRVQIPEGLDFTQTLSDKLDGIAEGAEVNVQADWNEATGTSDAFIQNKPTIPVARTDEEIRDVVGATLVDGEGINIAIDDDANTITISATGTSFDAPRVSNFAINIPSRVDLNTDLNNARTLTFDVLHQSSIQGNLNLEVTTGTNQVVSTPFVEGANSKSVTLAGIDTSSNTTITFLLTGTDTAGNPIQSNEVVITVRDLEEHEFIYYGIGNIDPNTVDVSTLQSQDVTTGSEFSAQLGPSTAGQDIVFLAPTDHDINAIINTSLNINVLPSFTRVENERIINSVQYHSYELDNLNSGLTFNYTVRYN